MLHGLNLLVSLSKFNIDTTKNRWYRIDLKKLVSRIPRSAYNHSTPILCHREILGSLQQMYQMPVSSRNEHVYGDTKKALYLSERAECIPVQAVIYIAIDNMSFP